MKRNIKFAFTFLLGMLFLVSSNGCKKTEETAPSTGSGGGITTPPATSVMINGYVPDWLSSGSYSSIDYANLTIAYYAFVVCDVNGNLLDGNGGNLATNTTQQNNMNTMIASAHAAGTKAYLSFGGGSYFGSQTFYNMARIDATRKEFAHQVKDFCISKGFDGFDVDWEGLGSSAEGAAHEALLATLKDTLHSVGLGLVVTVQQGANSASNFTYTGVNHADLVQIMSYDATGTWAGSPSGQHSSYNFAQQGISYWGNTRGVSKSKLVLGVPYYGYRFAATTSFVSYKQIVGSYPTLADDQDYIPTGALSETYYNGFETLMAKTYLAYENRMPGIMIWEMSLDASGAQSLTTKIVNELSANDLTVMKLTNSIP